jgi:hypothetical protein
MAIAPVVVDFPKPNLGIDSDVNDENMSDSCESDGSLHVHAVMAEDKCWDRSSSLYSKDMD